MGKDLISKIEGYPGQKLENLLLRLPIGVSQLSCVRDGTVWTINYINRVTK